MSNAIRMTTEIYEEEEGTHHGHRATREECVNIHFRSFQDMFAEEIDSNYYDFLYFGSKHTIGVDSIREYPQNWEGEDNVNDVKFGLSFFLRPAVPWGRSRNNNVEDEDDDDGYNKKLFTIHIRDPDGNIVFTNIGIVDCIPKEICRLLPSDLASPQQTGTAINDGTYSFEIRFEYRRDVNNPVKIFIPQNPISKNMLGIFMDEESSDVKFQFKTSSGVAYCFAHRIVLQACAPTLAEICKKKSESQTLLIEDTSYEIFHKLLFYIYGGIIQNKTFEQDSLDLIDAANRYGVVNLKLEAEAQHVKLNKITLDNAIDTLLWADGKHCALVKEQVMDFFMENKRAVHKIISSNENSLPPSVAADILAATMIKDAENSNHIRDYADCNMMRVCSLRQKLQDRGLDIDGSREMMIARLEEKWPTKRARLSK